MSMLSELWKKNKVKDRINQSLKDELAKLRPQMIDALAKKLAPKAATEATDDIIKLLSALVDKVC